MSALFCHDHRFVIAPDGRVYSSGQYDRATVARYEAVFGALTIAARSRPLGPSEDLAELSEVFDDASRLIAIPDLSSLYGLTRGGAIAATRLRPLIAAVDVVIVRLPSEVGLVAWREARRAGKALLVQAVACAEDGLTSHGSVKARLYAPIARRRMQHAVRNSDFVQYVTQGFLQSRYPTRGASTGVSNVELERIDPVVVERRLGAIESTNSARIFGMVAALFHKEKGIDVAIDALAKARVEDPSLRLRVLGPGDAAPWRAHARRAGVEQAVEFCGAAPRGQAVLRWIDGIDVYVQASFQEGLPRALIEAMSRATPALASSAGGTSELIADAWRHSPGDSTTLARQMLAIRPAEVRRPLALANVKKAEEYVSDLLDCRRSDFWARVVEAAA